MKKDYLWVEKYRPSTIDECILPSRLSKTFKKFIKDEDHPHLILSGPPGTGKTSLAKAMCNVMDRNYLFINGSDESGIDVFRTTIKDFATRATLDGRKKTVIFDEGDQLNPKSTQPALRSFLEEYAHICKFIFTVNAIGNIIEPLISRCTVVNFIYSIDERKEVAIKYIARLKQILKDESITYDSEATINRLIVSKFPDFRSVINSCQGYVTDNGEINLGILNSTRTHEDYSGLLDAVVEKKFKALEDFAIKFSSEDSSTFYRQVYNSLKSHIKNESDMSVFVPILGEYQKYHSGVADKYIHILSCLVELMKVEIFTK